MSQAVMRKSPLKVVGWLSWAGHQTVIDHAARAESGKQTAKGATESKPQPVPAKKA